jgi:hypothetical protein
MDDSAAKALRQYILDKIKRLREWVKPEPADPLLLKIGKLFFKSLVLLLLTALSPVILVVLLIAFIGAF